MVKPKSNERKEYEKEYRYLRLNAGVTQHREPIWPTSDAQDCAILSYDYNDSTFSGWINRQRMSKFKILQQVKKLREIFPL